jgi:hypothetical protein
MDSLHESINYDNESNKNVKTDLREEFIMHNNRRSKIQQVKFNLK